MAVFTFLFLSIDRLNDKMYVEREPLKQSYRNSYHHRLKQGVWLILRSKLIENKVHAVKNQLM